MRGRCLWFRLPFPGIVSGKPQPLAAEAITNWSGVGSYPGRAALAHAVV